MSKIQELAKRIARLELRKARWKVFAPPFSEDQRHEMLEAARRGYSLLVITWADDDTPEWLEDLCEEMGFEGPVQLEFGDG
jgi:hypothetical protein